MKKFFKLFAVIALVAVIGFSMAACGSSDDNNGGGGGGAKSITITGVTGDGAILAVISSFKDEEAVAGDMVAISGNSVTFNLTTDGITPWTGSGSYILLLYIFFTEAEDTDVYVYTNGATLASLGITADSDDDDAMAKLPKYNITSASSSIPFSKFAKIPDDWD